MSEKVSFEDKAVLVAKIPIEFRSNYCSTVLKKDRPTTECQFDPGSYHILKGSEKIIMSQERIAENKILVFSKKDPTPTDVYQFARDGNVDELIIALNQGDNSTSWYRDNDGDTALHVAAIEGDINIVEMLLNRGIDINLSLIHI